MNGVRRVTRAGGKQLYYVAFSFRRVQCREAVHLAHSKANDGHCISLRGEILRKIGTGAFESLRAGQPFAPIFIGKDAQAQRQEPSQSVTRITHFSHAGTL